MEGMPADGGRAGFLRKKADKGLHGFRQWKRKWVLLDDGGLSWADSPSAKPKGRLELDAAWLVRVSDPAAGRFELGGEQGLLALQAAEPAEARGWTDALFALRARRTARWEDRMLARVGASAGDRERLRAVCETWHDGHLTLVRERAAEAGAGAAGAADAAAAPDAAAAAAASVNTSSAGGAGGASGAQRVWCVLDRATLWLWAGPRGAGAPLGCVALESVEAIRSLAGQRSLALVAGRGDSLVLTADTRRDMLQWSLAMARAHSAARHLLRAQVLRRIDTAAVREPAGPHRPPPSSAHAAMAAERAAKALAAGVAAGADGRPLPGAVPDGGVILTPQQAGGGCAAGRGGEGCAVGCEGACASDDGGSDRSGHGGGGGGGGGARGGHRCASGGQPHASLEAHTLHVGASAAAAAAFGSAAGGYAPAHGGGRARGAGEGADGGAGGPAPVREGSDDGDGEEEEAGLAAWSLELWRARQRRPPGCAGALALCGLLPAALLHCGCLLCPRGLRRRTRRALRSADQRVRSAGQHALHSASEVAVVVDARLLGGAGGTASAAIGSALLSLADDDDDDDGGGGEAAAAREAAQTRVLLLERRTDAAELRVESVRDGAGVHVRCSTALRVCGQRVPVTNRWAKKALGVRVCAESVPLLWAYAANLGRLCAAHARATGQPLGGGAGAQPQRVLRPPPRLASAAASAPGGAHAPVPLSHFLKLAHTLPLVPPSGAALNLEALAAEVACAEAADAGPRDRGGGSAAGPAGEVEDAFGGPNAAALAAAAEGGGSFLAPLLRCREPAACKAAFFKAVPALQAALRPLQRAGERELGESEAAELAARVANLWQAVLDAGGGLSER